MLASNGPVIHTLLMLAVSQSPWATADCLIYPHVTLYSDLWRKSCHVEQNTVLDIIRYANGIAENNTRKYWLSQVNLKSALSSAGSGNKQNLQNNISSMPKTDSSVTGRCNVFI